MENTELTKGETVKRLITPIRAITFSHAQVKKFINRIYSNKNKWHNISSVIGYLVAEKHEDGYVYITHSICNPDDYFADRYDKKLGQNIAIARQYEISKEFLDQMLFNKDGIEYKFVIQRMKESVATTHADGCMTVYAFPETIAEQRNAFIRRCTRYFKNVWKQE